MGKIPCHNYLLFAWISSQSNIVYTTYELSYSSTLSQLSLHFSIKLDGECLSCYGVLDPRPCHRSKAICFICFVTFYLPSLKLNITSLLTLLKDPVNLFCFISLYFVVQVSVERRMRRRWCKAHNHNPPPPVCSEPCTTIFLCVCVLWLLLNGLTMQYSLTIMKQLTHFDGWPPGPGWSAITP